MKVKKVFKYGTGQVIPERAIYLSTQVETISYSATQGDAINESAKRVRNEFVWHYFLVEVESSEE